MTEIKYQERQKEADAFLSMTGAVDYISNSVSVKSGTKGETTKTRDVGKNNDDARDDSLQWTLPLNNSSLDMLGFNPEKVFNMRTSKATRQVNVETREETEKGLPSPESIHENEPVAVVSVKSLNLAPDKVYTGMSMRYEELLRDDNGSREVRRTNSNTRKARWAAPSPASAPAAAASFTPTSQWRREREMEDMAHKFEEGSEDRPLVNKQAPPKYSVSKIYKARAGPAPKADDFFEELKKWHKNYSLRDVEKPAEITITVVDPPLHAVEEDNESANAVVDKYEKVAISTIADSSKKRKSKGKSLFWNRRQQKPTRIVEDDDCSKSGIEVVSITKQEQKKDKKERAKKEKTTLNGARVNIEKKIQQKEVKPVSPLIQRDLLMKEMMQAAKRREAGAAVTKRTRSNSVVRSTPEMKMVEEELSRDESDTIKETQSDQAKVTTKQRRKSWGLKLPTISRKKNKTSKKVESAKPSESKASDLDESPKVHVADPPANTSKTYSNLGLSQSSTSKPIKPPSFNDTMNKFIMLDLETSAEKEKQDEQFAEAIETIQSTGSDIIGEDEEQMEDNVIIQTVGSTGSELKTDDTIGAEEEQEELERIQTVISTTSSINVDSHDGYQVIVETVSSTGSDLRSEGKRDRYQDMVETASSSESELKEKTNANGGKIDTMIETVGSTLSSMVETVNSTLSELKSKAKKSENQDEERNDAKALGETPISNTNMPKKEDTENNPQIEEVGYVLGCPCQETNESWLERASKYFFFTDIEELHKVDEEEEGDEEEQDDNQVEEDEGPLSQPSMTDSALEDEVEGPSDSRLDESIVSEEIENGERDSSPDSAIQSNEPQPEDLAAMATGNTRPDVRSLLDIESQSDVASVQSQSIKEADLNKIVATEDATLPIVVDDAASESRSCAGSKVSHKSGRSATKSIPDSDAPDEPGSCQGSKESEKSKKSKKSLESKKSRISKASKKSFFSKATQKTQATSKIQHDDESTSSKPTQMIILKNKSSRVNGEQKNKIQESKVVDTTEKTKKSKKPTKPMKDRNGKRSKNRKKEHAVTLFGKLGPTPETKKRKTQKERKAKLSQTLF